MNSILYTKVLLIGGFTIKLSNTNTEIGLDIGYIPFLINKETPKPSVNIEVIESIPKELKEENNLIFETTDGNQKLWYVCAQDDGYKVIVYNPVQPTIIQQVAIISRVSNQWKIYCEPTENNLVMPFSYPMGPIILYYITTRYNAIMIHSSGIVDGPKGRLFSGFSGVGKSTMAEIWQQKGNTLINDDRLFLTVETEKVMMHNTPMFYEDSPKANNLNAIYLLKQSKENNIRQLHNAEAISRLLAFCIQHSYNKDFLENHLKTVSVIYKFIPIYELGFKPDADIIDFIRAHE